MPAPPNKIEHIKLSLMDPMPGNRPFDSGMDKKSLNDLCASILAQSIVQPLIVRAHPAKKGRFEIVAGVRRHAAAALAKLSEAPCIVRELTDSQAREIRIIENLQRVGVHEMEEGRGYQELLDMREEKTGEPMHTIQSICEKIGKSEAYVYARLKLLRMPDVAQEAFVGGKLSASVALLVSRIPDPKMAYKATLEVLDHYGSGITPERAKRALDPENEPMSFRKAKYHLQDKYMKRLKGAKFDQEDETLVPAVFEELPPLPPGQPPQGALPQGDRLHGGKCSDCPFRTGNMRKLAPDLCKDVEGSTDVCTNTACFQLKEKATIKREAAKFKDKGQVLLTEGQTRGVLNHDGTELRATDEYIDLRAKVPGKKVTWEEALEEHLPENAKPAVARGKKNFLLLPIDTAIAAAKKAGIKIEKPEPRSHGYDPEAQRREEEKRKQRKLFTDGVVAEAFRQLEAAMPKQKPEEILRFTVNQYSNQLRLPQWKEEKRPSEKEFLKLTKEMSLIQLAVALALNSVPNGSNWQGEINDSFIETCSNFGIDVKTIVEAKGKEQKEAEAKAKAETKPEPAKK